MENLRNNPPPVTFETQSGNFRLTRIAPATDSLDPLSSLPFDLTQTIFSFLGDDTAEINATNQKLHAYACRFSKLSMQPFRKNVKSLIDAINLTPYLDRSVHFKALLKKLSSQKEGFLFLESSRKFLEIKLQMLCIKVFSPEEREAIRLKITDSATFYDFLKESPDRIIDNALKIAEEIVDEQYKFLALKVLIFRMTKPETLVYSNKIAEAMDDPCLKKMTIEIIHNKIRERVLTLVDEL